MLRKADEHPSEQESAALLLVALGYDKELVANYVKLGARAVENHRLELCRKPGIVEAGNLDTVIAVALSQSTTPATQ